jgi:succinate dehydrogenase assembly factor 2
MFKSFPLLRTYTRRLAFRTYRGQAGEGTPTLSSREEALLQVALPRAEAIMTSHTRLPNLPDKGEELQVRRKRLIYRSKQRGWLEVDLLLGTWAHQNVPQLSAQQLDEYESFVNQETIDIYNIITLRLPVPDELKGTIVDEIQEWARANPLGKADPLKYKQVKENNQLT